MELQKDVDGSECCSTSCSTCYYRDMTQRELAVKLSGYLAERLDCLRPDEAWAPHFCDCLGTRVGVRLSFQEG